MTTNGVVPSPARSTRRLVGSDEFVVQALSPRTFTIVWWSLLSARCACALFLVVLSRVYAGLTTKCMEYYATLLSPKSAALYPPISWFLLLLSLAHVIQIAKIVAASIKARRLVFNSISKVIVHNNQTAASQPAARKVQSRWRRLYRLLFSRQGFFGAESAFFEFQFLLREVVEMASQTSQVMQGSNLIGRPWINHALVASLFVNSWSTPAIGHFTHRFPALERLLCLTADLILDGIMNMVLPIVLEMRYYRSYDAARCTFDVDVLYSDVEGINLIMESRMIFVQGSVDLALKLAPHLSIFLCLRSIQSLIRPDTKKKCGEQTKQPGATGSGGANGPRASFLIALHRPTALRTSLSMRIRHMQSRRLRGRKAAIVHAIFLLWGIIVVAMHTKTTWRSNLAEENNPTGCMQPLRPWFATKPACSVFRYSCLNDNATSPVEQTLAVLDETSLALLILSDCTDLQMPKVLQNFSGLLQLEIWRSHITRWGSEAAITASTHPFLLFCGLVKTTMHEIPEGLLLDLPATLQDIEISHCNLTSLPVHLDIAWANVETLYIEYCDLDEFPPVVLRMEIDDLSLVGNKLTNVPALPDNYFSLALSNNRQLASLDNNAATIRRLAFLALENTALASFPPWIERSGAKVTAFGTEFCANLPPAELETHYGAGAALTCIDTNSRTNGRYPLEFVEALRYSNH